MDERVERPLTQQEIDAAVRKDNAEAAKAEAEAKKLMNEAEEAEAKVRVARNMAEKSDIEMKVTLEKEARRLNGDVPQHVYRFLSAVDAASAQQCVSELTYWDREDPTCPITLVFMSPGGAVIPGMALFDFLRSLSDKGHEITTVCSGYAASMAGILLQAGDIRVCGPESYILIHELAAATMGKIGDMADDVAFYKKICERVLNIFVNRSGGKLSKRVMKKNWTRKDWWLDSDEALRLGIVDEVR